jgi:hypothetical protein
VLLIEGERDELNPAYHTCGDVASVCDFDYMAACTKVALGTVALLAGFKPYTGVETDDRIVLHRNLPNPFSSHTLISFSLPVPCNVELAVYDAAGRRVAHLMRGWMGPDLIECGWDGRSGTGGMLSSGVYFLRLKAGTAEIVRKIVIVR